jgi:hypothetical protein
VEQVDKEMQAEMVKPMAVQEAHLQVAAVVVAQAQLKVVMAAQVDPIQ